MTKCLQKDAFFAKGQNTMNTVTYFNFYNAELFLLKPWRLKGFAQFEIIINVLVISFRFIWIGLPMLWVHGH